MSSQASLFQTDINSSRKKLKTESLFSRHNSILCALKSEFTLTSKASQFHLELYSYTQTINTQSQKYIVYLSNMNFCVSMNIHLVCIYAQKHINTFFYFSVIKHNLMKTKPQHLHLSTDENI